MKFELRKLSKCYRVECPPCLLKCLATPFSAPGDWYLLLGNNETKRVRCCVWNTCKCFTCKTAILLHEQSNLSFRNNLLIISNTHNFHLIHRYAFSINLSDLLILFLFVFDIFLFKQRTYRYCRNAPNIIVVMLLYV